MRIVYLLFCIVWPVVWSFQRPKLPSCKPVSGLSCPLLPIKSLGDHSVSMERQGLISNEDNDVCVDDHHDDTMIMVGSFTTMSFLLFMPMLVHAMDVITVGSGSSIDVPLAVATVDFQAILAKASSRALDGGTAGASAAAIQG